MQARNFSGLVSSCTNFAYFYTPKQNHIMSIAYQLSFVRGTLPEDVTLVAVSKTHPAGAIREAYDAGHRIFGESRPQELRE